MKKLIFLPIFLFSGLVFSQTINIPADYSTIQEGIDMAFDGALVLVQPGTYYEKINFNGKKITVASLYLLTQDTSIISQTIIDANSSWGNDYGSVVSFINNEDSSSVLQGFTVRGGHTNEGGGIRIRNASPKICYCKITDNICFAFGGAPGGGIFISNGSPVLQYLIISKNISSSGGGIYLEDANPVMSHIVIKQNSGYGYGGGLCCFSATPYLSSVVICKNSSSYGGGMYLQDSNPNLSNVTIRQNAASETGGGIWFSQSFPVFNQQERCNLYENMALNGNDLFCLETMFQINHDILVDTFTVLNPTSYFAKPLSHFSFDILNGYIQQEDADLYVSPSGDNNNSGLNPDEPVKTIRHAISKIIVDSIHQNSIYLLDGKYSPSTNGEIYPLQMIDFINLSGVSKEDVILDADSLTGTLILIDQTPGVSLSKLTITGGNENHLSNGFGVICCTYSNPILSDLIICGNQNPGIYCKNSSPLIKHTIIHNNLNSGIRCWYSNPIIEDVILSENHAYKGGGMSLYESSPQIHDVIIRNNEATEEAGGGIYCQEGSPVLKNVIITKNRALGENGYGGGVLFDNGNPVLENVTVSYNVAKYYGGGITFINSVPFFDTINRCNIYSNQTLGSFEAADLWSGEYITVCTDTFSVLQPTDFWACPIGNFDFDILHGIDNQNASDLYVSPAGDNMNSGLTEDKPLKNIYCAVAMCPPDSNNPKTIHLMEGTYSPSSNEEYFPIHLNDHIILSGSSTEGVTLDAENMSNVLYVLDKQGVQISNLTIRGGSEQDGGGVCIENASVSLSNIEILENHASSNGGGIYNKNGTLKLVNSSIHNNSAVRGGAFYLYDSFAEFEDLKIEDNTSIYDAGGIYSFFTDLKISESIINNNIAHSDGGAIHLRDSDATIYNTIFSENMADDRGGAIYYMTESNCLLINITISDNIAGDGGGLYVVSGNPFIYNTILWDNVPNEISGEATVSYSNISGGWIGEGNTDEVPLFDGFGDHPYQLSPYSPCIDRGTPDTAGLNLPTGDFLGNARIWDGDGDGVAVVDMGAYEFGSMSVGVSNTKFQISNFKFHCYPNPVLNKAVVRYLIKDKRYQISDLFVDLGVYDLRSVRVMTIVKEFQKAGEYSIKFDMSGLPAGVYLLKLQVGDEVEIAKLVKL